MTRRMIVRVVFHGALLVVLGMLVGFAFHRAITEGSGADVQRAWRVAHTSLVGGGALYLAFAAVAQYLVLSPQAARLAVWSLVVAAYAFAFGFVVGPAVGARGLEATGPPLHVLVFAALATGLFLLLLAACVILWGSYAALRALRDAE
jgi:vacuolar-type H+-ATPase subunit I/STV1